MSGGLFLLRFAVGAIFIYHAVPKLREPENMAKALGWASPQVVGLGIIEFMCALGLIGGLATHISSLVLAVVMAVAIYHKKSLWKVPFMSHNSTGWEFDFLLLFANITIYLN